MEEIESKFNKEQVARIKKIVIDTIEKSTFDPSTKIISFIEDEVRTQIKNNELHSYLKNLMRQYIEEHIQEIIKLVVEKNLEIVNRRLEKKLTVTKELCYSIDAEIRHTLIKLPTNYETDKKIVEFIQRELTQTKQITFKG